MSAQELVSIGFGGYQGWGDAEADADFRATGGAGKITGGGGRSSSSSGFNPISVQDFQKLEEQSFEMLKPYYIKIAQEARGDFNRAISRLDEDYKTGVRVANEDYTRETGDVREDLASATENMNNILPVEQEQLIDTLNRRGMAVGQMSPEGGFNALRVSPITMSGETAAITNPADPGVGGRGAVELKRLQTDQRLRAEAVQRSAGRQLEGLGINLGRFTNTAGTNGSPDALAKADRTKLGSAELGLVRGRESTTREQQLKEQAMAEQRRKEAFGIASTMAGISSRELPASLAQRYLKNDITDFQERGV